MILLKLFMHLLKPRSEWLKKKSNGTFIRLCINLYQSTLKYLLKRYRYYAISDTISIDGRVKIIHEFRDLEFEHELTRNGIDVGSHMLPKQMSFVNTKGTHKSCFRYFKWKDLISVYVDKYELFIKHDNIFTIDGNVVGKIESSSSEDIIIRSIVELMPMRNDLRTENIQSSTFSRNKKSSHTKIDLFKREQIIKRETEVIENIPPLIDEPRIIKQGFEIDTTY